MKARGIFLFYVSVFQKKYKKIQFSGLPRPGNLLHPLRLERDNFFDFYFLQKKKVFSKVLKVFFGLFLIF